MESTIKVNIECGDKPRNGYINTVSNSATVEQISKEYGDDIDVRLMSPQDALSIDEDKKVSEVIIGFYMNVFSPEDIGRFLSMWTERLSDEGVIKFKFIDARQVCRMGAFGNLSLGDLHKMMLGNESFQFKSVSDYESVKNMFNNSPCRIKYSKNANYEIYLEIEKVPNANQD